ncbi:MAG: helix-turn-helix transcriptional regulator [Spirochaetales bacterium]|nr:helix-turn-helix transcriptional regulator [Spirochaetales bacterium]
MKKNLKTLQDECISCPFPDEVKDDMCYICSTQQIIRGKWKLLIIWLLRKDPVRFSQLQRKIPNVKQGPLTSQLKELVESGIVKRKSYNQVPPKVEYSLTSKGRDFLKVMAIMHSWAKENLFIEENRL